MYLLRTKVVRGEAAGEKRLIGTPRGGTGNLVTVVPVYGAGARSGGQGAGVVGGDDGRFAVFVHVCVKHEGAIVAVQHGDDLSVIEWRVWQEGIGFDGGGAGIGGVVEGRDVSVRVVHVDQEGYAGGQVSRGVWMPWMRAYDSTVTYRNDIMTVQFCICDHMWALNIIQEHGLDWGGGGHSPPVSKLL